MDTMHLFVFGLVAVMAVYVGSAIGSFVLGERLLRELRDRYPGQWAQAGNPTYVSFALAGAKWWRPVSAMNYFRLSRYLSVPDPDYVSRASRVRTWHRVMNGTRWAMVGFMLVAAFVLR